MTTERQADDFADVALITRMLTARDPGEEVQPPVATQSLSGGVIIYKFDDNATARQKKAVLAMLTLCARCVDIRNSSWQSFVLTYSVLCFPELADLIANQHLRDYTMEVLPKSFVASCVDVVEYFMQTDSPSTPPALPFPLGLPQAGAIEPTAELVSCAIIEGLYAYHALLVFLMGKNITALNRTSITTKRPDALIKRFQCGQAEYILKGEGRISDECHTLVTGGWVRSTGPRIVIVKHFAQLMQVKQQQTTEILGNIFGLMEYSGAQAVYYINRLLIAHPWVARLAVIKASFHSYSESVRALHTQPHWYKPYYKLAMHDSTRLFRRRDLNPLIAIAIVWERQTNTTLSRFTIAANMQGVIDVFVRECARRNVTIIVPENQEIATAV